MADLINALSYELTALTSETRRKYPEVKEAADRVLIQLKAYRALTATEVISAIISNHAVLSPILLACHARQPRLATIAVNCLQHLIVHSAVSPDAIGTIVTTLGDIVSLGADVQLRTLQIVLPLLSNYPNVHDNELVETLVLCYRLQESTAPMVNSIAGATFRQLINIVFDKVSKEDATLKESDEYHPCADDAIRLLKDLCLLTNGEPGIFLRLDELLESILSSYESLFRAHASFLDLVREQLCPLIIRYFSDRNDFPKIMRLVRVINVLVRQYHDVMTTECEIYLSMLLKMLETDQNPAWQRVLALELFRNVCSNFQLLYSIYSRYSNNKGKAKGIYHAGTRININECNSDEEQGAILDTRCRLKIACIDQLDKTEPPVMSQRYQYYLAFTCMINLTNAFADFIQRKFDKHSLAIGRRLSPLPSPSPLPSFVMGRSTRDCYKQARVQEIMKEPLDEELEAAVAMADTAWPGLLAGLSAYLTTPLDDDLYHLLMKAFRQFSITVGVLGLTTPRNAFLTSLCKNAIPQMSTGDELARTLFSERHTTCMQALLDVCGCLMELLDVDTWYSVLVTFEYVNHLLHGRAGGRKLPKHMLSGSTIRPLRKMSASSTRGEGEGSVLLTDMQMLFEQASELEIEPFERLIRGLCRLSSESNDAPLPNDSTSNEPSSSSAPAAPAPAPPSSSSSSRTNNKSTRIYTMNRNNEPSFAIDRLKLVILRGMRHLLSTTPENKLWDLAIGHLIDTCIAAATPARLREQAGETIGELISSAMTTAETMAIQDDKHIQLRLLDHYVVCCILLVDIRRVGLETLDKLLQTSGQSFTHGWSMILEMLAGVCSLAILSDTTSSLSATTATSQTAISSTASFIQPLGLTRTTSLNTTPFIGRRLSRQPSPLPSPTRSMSTSGLTFPSTLVKVGFSSLRLICSDFLGSLSPACLYQCITALGAYGWQTEDLNISLTAIGQLWNLSDFLQTSRQKTNDISSVTSSNTPTDDTAEHSMSASLANDITLNSSESTNEEAHSALVNEAIVTPSTPSSLLALWLLVLLELEMLAADTRPEVRNSAIQTLFRTVSLNGSVLDATAWTRCVYLVLFPTAEHVIDACEQALAQVANTVIIEPVKGGAPARDIDAWSLHSRISPEQQWDETKTLLIQGFTQVFTGYLFADVKMPDSAVAWSRWLSVLNRLCLHSTRMVTTSAIDALRQIINQPNNKDQQVAVPWMNVWEVWAQVGRGMTSKEMPMNYLDYKIIASFIRAYAELHVWIHEQMNDERLSVLLDILYELVILPQAVDLSLDINRLNDVQEAVINAVNAIDNTNTDIAAVLLLALSRFYSLAPQASVMATMITTGGVANDGIRGKPSTYIALARHSMELTRDLFKQHAHAMTIYNDGIFTNIIERLEKVVAAKRSNITMQPTIEEKNEPLWRFATQTAILS
ncbi:guanine nucleotide exchange factor in Golgi transport N-terminal-domain-containing protein [Syncephalis plumigaleata]|nr:guanine nucleotide exchange factor in Golgi transport N-terminal-domain-containing protein [Syncephalis plumigaleata]